jgi:hypothetical protein
MRVQVTASRNYFLLVNMVYFNYIDLCLSAWNLFLKLAQSIRHRVVPFPKPSLIN